MFRLTEPGEKFLQQGQYIRFTGREVPEEYRDKVFRVHYAVRTVRDKVIGILPPGKTGKVTLTELEPVNKTSIFQVRIGIHDLPINLYVYYPEARIRLGLEQPEVDTPIPGDTDKGYIGFFNYHDTPRQNPRLELFCLKGLIPAIGYWNDGDDYAKLVLRELVNMAEVVEVTGDELQAVLERRAYIEIPGPDIVRW